MPTLKQIKTLLRPIAKARTGKRIAFFFQDKGIKGVPGHASKDIIARYFRKNGIKIQTTRGHLSGRDSGSGPDNYISFGNNDILLPQCVSNFLMMFDNGKFPSITSKK